MSSEGFWFSSRKAYLLMLKHAPTFGQGNSIGWVLMLCGTLSVTLLNVALCLVLLTYQNVIIMTNPFTPCLAVALVTVIVCYHTLSIFTFAADAFYQAFLVDEDLRF